MQECNGPASGMVHLGMQSNVSGVVQAARSACRIPQLMHGKIKHILLNNVVQRGNYNNSVYAKKEAAELFVHYERVRTAMQVSIHKY